MKKKPFVLVVSLFLFLLVSRANACELCATFNSVESSTGSVGEFQSGVSYSHQFSDSVARPEGRPFLDRQEIQTNIWQFVGTYYATNDLAFSANLPVIYKSFKHYRNGRIASDEKSGIGDVTVLLKYRLLREENPDWSVSWEVFSGVKLPTGESDSLREEANEEDLDNRVFLRHGDDGSGNIVGGDDVTLGSGSVDVPFGTSAFARYGRNQLALNAQYNLRTEGRADYEFGDDLQWQMSLGRYVLLEDEFAIAPRVRLSGEAKGHDTINGQELALSDETNLFLGPEVVATVGNNLFVSLAFDFAVKNDDAERELASKYRAQASVIYTF